MKRLLASAGIGVVLGGGLYTASEIAATPEVVAAPAQVEACARYLDTVARYLGTTSISSEDLAGPCKEVPGLLDRKKIYSFKAGEDGSTLVDTVFLLPAGDGDEFRSRSMEIISERKEQNKRNGRLKKILSAVLALGSGITIYNQLGKGSTQRRNRELEARIR